MRNGIDVSEHNGEINWTLVKNQIDFAFIRAGYGSSVDATFHRNASECSRLDIPFGVYWFSYALNQQDAGQEAKTCIRLCSPYSGKLGIAFDYEDDSDRLFKKAWGRAANENELCSMANAFLSNVKSSGYKPILYSNQNYLNRGFNAIKNSYSLWYANWRAELPENAPKCEFWQHSASGRVNGIKTVVDLNKQFDSETVTKNHADIFNAAIEKLSEKRKEEYYNTAMLVLAGKFGNGETRKAALAACGYDYNIVQSIVNILCG